jgi:hypothetical protein
MIDPGLTKTAFLTGTRLMPENVANRTTQTLKRD